MGPAVGAMAAAILVVFLALPDSAANRVSTLDLANGGFGDNYIQHIGGDRTQVTIGARARNRLLEHHPRCPDSKIGLGRHIDDQESSELLDVEQLSSAGRPGRHGAPVG